MIGLPSAVYQPHRQVLFADDFDRGLEGWTGLVGNYEGSLDAMLPAYRDLRPPMLSNCTTWDTGTGGAATGTYALKLATRPRADSLAVAVKRWTYRQRVPIRLEALFTFKPEASQMRLADEKVASVGVLFDLQDDNQRVMPHLRYLNAGSGGREGRWQFKRRREPMQPIGDSGETVSHFHFAPEGWEDLPGGRQDLCYNEIATKQNWHYLRVDFDLASMQLTGFQCNDRHFDPAGFATMAMPAMPNLWCMLNVLFFCQATRGTRAFLYLDSVVLSADLTPGP